MPRNGKEPRNIIVFRTGQLGDTIVSLPAIHTIRNRYPNYELILLTPLSSGSLVSPLEVLGASKLFSQVLFYAPPSSNPITWYGLFKLGIKIRRLKPAVFFYLRDFPHDGLRRDKLFFQIFCGLRNASGMTSPMMSFGQRDDVGNLVRYQSELERLVSIAMGPNPGGPSHTKMECLIPISEREGVRIDSLWCQSGIQQNELLVALGPGSKMPAKRWPLARFIELGRHILSELPYSRVVVVGGVEDAPIGQEIQQALGERVVIVAGELSILESAEVLRRCAIYVGNDTGVMHLAAAVGTPCVAIFSARDHPGRWEPWGRDHIVLRKEVPCAGCLLDICIERDMACLKEIGTDEVFCAVRKILVRKNKNTTACVQ